MNANNVFYNEDRTSDKYDLGLFGNDNGGMISHSGKIDGKLFITSEDYLDYYNKHRNVDCKCAAMFSDTYSGRTESERSRIREASPRQNDRSVSMVANDAVSIPEAKNKYSRYYKKNVKSNSNSGIVKFLASLALIALAGIILMCGLIMFGNTGSASEKFGSKLACDKNFETFGVEYVCSESENALPEYFFTDKI